MKHTGDNVKVTPRLLTTRSYDYLRHNARIRVLHARRSTACWIGDPPTNEDSKKANVPPPIANHTRMRHAVVLPMTADKIQEAYKHPHLRCHAQYRSSE